MVRDLNRHFFQRRLSNGQLTHEKMCNISNHQGNATKKTTVKYNLTLFKLAMINRQKQ